MRLNLKLAVITKGIGHQAIANAANKFLEPDERLTELGITKLITERRDPTARQAAALARVLGRSSVELFPPTEEGRDREQI